MKLQLASDQRLKKKKEIDLLFADGKSFNLPPIRVIYTVNPEPNSKNQLLFSVPSRAFKRAVDRNLLKRRMRESYRVNQFSLDLPVKLNLAYIYIAKKALPYSEIEKKIIQSFQKLKNEFEA
jgi:ribonuclease P protein component